MRTAIGVVRRLDDLGRVVIPKEVRKKLRIKEGDPLEVFVTTGGVFLKKYSPIGGLVDLAKEYAEALFETTTHMVLITDKDTILAVAGGSLKTYFEKPIGSSIEKCIENQIPVMQVTKGEYEVSKNVHESFESSVMAPIIADGYVIGTVVMLSHNTNAEIGQVELKIAETAATFLAKQVQS